MGISKIKYILIIISLVMLNSCGTIIHNIGYGLSESEIEGRYRDAESMYNAILDGNLESSQKNWDKVIKEFNYIIEHHPKSRVADDAQYSLGLCYIWENNHKKDSLKKAIKAFDRLTYHYPKSELVPNTYYWRAYAYCVSGDYKRAILEFERFRMKFPKSPLYADAEYQISECRAKLGIDKEPLKDYKIPEQKAKEAKTENKEQFIKKEQIEKTKPNIKPPEVKPLPQAEIPKEPPKDQGLPKEKKDVKEKRLSLEKIRFSSSQGYTRIVLDMSQPVKYDSMRLDDPDRICINIKNAVISSIKQDVDINDDLIKAVSSAQFDDNTIRVVIDLKKIKNYKIFTLENPFRIVVDVFGQDKKPDSNTNKATPSNNTKLYNKEPSKSVTSNQTLTLTRQLGLKVRTIVIDPGHGGKDPGAVSKSGTYEKHIVLDIAKRLKNMLKAKGSYEVYMTRDTDDFIQLEDRTGFANRAGADVFISLHVNSSKSASARGIEVYYLSIAGDEESRMTAALENASSERGIRDLGTLLGRMLKGAKIDESRSLAQTMQSHLCKIARANDRGVKRAPFIVLIGANAPSILVEMGFISNAQDEKLLKSDEYKDEIVKSLMNGIEEYVRTMNPSG